MNATGCYKKGVRILCWEPEPNDSSLSAWAKAEGFCFVLFAYLLACLLPKYSVP